MSINRGFIFEVKSLEEREKLEKVIHEEAKKFTNVQGCLYFTDEEVINIAASLASKIKSDIVEAMNQEGITADVDKVWEIDPGFLEKFVHTIAINKNLDDMTLAKYIFIDIRTGRNLTDAEIIKLFTKVCQLTEIKGILHIPTASDKKIQTDLFFKPETGDITIEQNRIGAPAFSLTIGRPVPEAELAAQKEAGVSLEELPNKIVTQLLFPYGSIAEIYDEMLSFLIEKNYEYLALGISRSKDDIPIYTNVKDLQELYEALCVQHAQVSYYGAESGNIINIIPR